MQKTIDTEWLTRTTGDPFADTGGMVIKYLYSLEEFKGKDIMELVRFITDIYVNKWESKLNSFFLNSKITQPAWNSDKKITETLNYYQSLLDETAPHIIANCRVTGVKGPLFVAGRENYPLAGSGTFVNFHTDFEAGIYVSKEIHFRIFFLPFGVQMLGGKIAVISSNSIQINEHFVFSNVKANFESLATGLTPEEIEKGECLGVVRSKFTNPANAIFAFLDSCHAEFNIDLYDPVSKKFKGDPISLTLYNFTNFGATPEADIQEIGSPIFNYYSFCNNSEYQDDWRKFIRANYRNSKMKQAVFVEEEQVYKNMKTGEVYGYEEYRAWSNAVLRRLLNDDYLLKSFLKWGEKHLFPMEIVKIYLMVLKNRNAAVLEKLTEIATYIVADKDSDFIKKTIGSIRSAKNRKELRKVILKLQIRHSQKAGEKALLTIDEYAEIILPENGKMHYNEVRDFLLLTIYQKMLEMNIVIESVEAESEVVSE